MYETYNLEQRRNWDKTSASAHTLDPPLRWPPARPLPVSPYHGIAQPCIQTINSASVYPTLNPLRSMLGLSGQIQTHLFKPDFTDPLLL